MTSKKLLHFSLLLLVLFSCKDSGVLVKPKYKTTIFHGQQGDTEVNAFNRKQAEREKSLASEIEKSEQALQMLKEQQKMFYSIDSTERIKEIDDQLNRLMARTEEIIKSLNETDPYTPEGHEKSLRLAKELNDLLYTYVVPLGELIASNKELKNIAADISFDTGSSVISAEGKKLITGILDSIKTDIQSWRKYLDNHDENVFSNEDYSTILIISGYSDTQGSGDEKTRVERNLALSEARAKAVAAEFEKQLKALDVKWKLTFRVSYEGKGEILPPAVTDDKQKNNPNRRVTTIRMVVGPKILLYNNGE
ncbi:MAG: OmpA family protein [Flavobacteriales bacterium]|jgi:outer membrane protein OmpA-like peptidoglycan-associated protein